MDGRKCVIFVIAAIASPVYLLNREKKQERYWFMEMQFTLVGNSTWVLDIDAKVRIGCDPALAPAGTVSFFKGMKIRRVRGPEFTDESFRNVGIWLLSHNHFDHLDKEGIGVMEKGSRVFSIPHCRSLLKGREDLQVSYMNWNDEETVSAEGYDIRIKAVPAFHGRGFMGVLVGGRVNGYVLTVSKDGESKTVYVSSDSIYSDEIRAALAGRAVDLMIANMGKVSSKLPGGPYTMDLPLLERFEKELKPRTVLPIHIDDYSHFETTRDEFEGRLKVLENGETILIA
jgi:L-ascorbate metabolism protein UlaG (beta-lactamase superfamily)